MKSCKTNFRQKRLRLMLTACGSNLLRKKGEPGHHTRCQADTIMDASLFARGAMHNLKRKIEGKH